MMWIGKHIRILDLSKPWHNGAFQLSFLTWHSGRRMRQVLNACGASPVPHERHSAGVAAKALCVLLDPLQHGHLVHDPVVGDLAAGQWRGVCVEKSCKRHTLKKSLKGSHLPVSGLFYPLEYVAINFATRSFIAQLVCLVAGHSPTPQQFSKFHSNAKNEWLSSRVLSFFLPPPSSSSSRESNFGRHSIWLLLPCKATSVRVLTNANNFYANILFF
jgi:hypothetical protein